MTHRRFALVLLTALVAMLALAGQAALAQTQARLILGSLSLAPGASDTVEAVLTCNPQCGSATLTLRFDPAIVRVDRLRLGGAFGNPDAGQVAAPENGIDNTSGQIDLALLAAAPVPEALDDVLFVLDITALAAGETIFTAERAAFSDLRGAALEGEVTGGVVTSTNEPVVAEITPTPTPFDVTPTPEATAAAAATGEACFVSTVNNNVAIHVGPDRDRAVRGSMPAGQEVAVTGQFTDEAGLVWWRVQPAGVTTELDRYWVLESDVDERGDCANVPQTEGSAVISGGAGFSHAFTGGERSFTHVVSLPGGSWSLTCSGVPTYPEFQLGSQRSSGQTSINGSGGGAQTLTVFSTVVNARGQTTQIASYSCTLARR